MAKKLGRPPKKAHEKRSEVVRVRITSEQHDHRKKHYPKGIAQWFRDKVDADIKAKARK